MERNYKREGIVLKYSKSGEKNRFVTLFTPQEGILRTTAFGAQSSRSSLTASTRLFQYGVFSLYHNPARPYINITDADIKLSFESLHEDILAFYTACVWSEIILISHGGGSSSREAFRLLILALTHLTSRTGSVHCAAWHLKFLSHLMILQGDFPDLKNCPVCSRLNTGEQSLFYVNTLHQFTCSSCSHERGYSLTGEERAAWRQLLVSGWDLQEGSLESQELIKIMTGRWEHLLGRQLKTAKALGRLV